ncbi:MAG TPA: HAD-IB family phosphatase [Polyangiales bacterium]|nr:HAD-IB family phosphatase [Polyangiales bacterium]
MDVPIVVTDFDGTLAVEDVGDRLCERYADPRWREFETRFDAGELSLPAAQRGMWQLIAASLDELRSHALSIGTLRAGAPELFAAARAGKLELVIASGGFDFYIEALLGAQLRDVRAAYYNSLAVSDWGLQLDFPHTDLACARCAVCKGKALRKHLDTGRRVLFCGDGTSDRCAVGVAPELFAVRGSHLAEYCRQVGAACTEFEDYREVLAALER